MADQEVVQAGNDLEVLRDQATRPDYRGTTFSVLNKGHVRLVDYMGADVSVARAARCSYNAAWRAGLNEQSDEKLIRYMLKNNHGTPFEAVTFTFEIKAPIFVFRQWHRHRTWGYNELSARYQELPEEFWIPEPGDIGAQSTTNKQVRVAGVPDLLAHDDRLEEIKTYRESCEAQFAVYRWLLRRGWAREMARACLPFSTYSVMFGTVNLRNLQAFLLLRMHEHAQPEIRVYAEALYELAALVAPVSMAEFNKVRTRMPYDELLKRCEDLEMLLQQSTRPA